MRILMRSHPAPLTMPERTPMTYRNRDDKAPHSMIEAFAAEFKRSAAQFDKNRYFLTEAGMWTQRDHYLGVCITTTSGAVHVGRIFDFYDVDETLTLITAPIDVRARVDLSDIVFIDVSRIESIEITEAFDTAFEVTFTRDDLNQVLDNLSSGTLEATQALHGLDADFTALFVEALTDVLGERLASPARQSLIEARNAWNHFKVRHHLSNGRRFPANGHVEGPAHLNASGVSEWYPSLVERDHDGTHIGEVIFRLLADGMPSDYLFPDTRTAVETAYHRQDG